MYYQKIIPIRPLQDYIRYFWVLEDIGDKTFKIIPDGLPGLIFQEEANLFLNNEQQILPQMFLYGQTTCHGEQKATASFRSIGVYLQPTALKAIFNIDAFELTNQHIPIDCITADPILEQLANAASISEKIEIISNFFLERIQQVKVYAAKADFATLLLNNGKTLKDVQMEMNLSERSLERLLKQYVGISPKVFSRIVRFQSGLQALRQNDFNNLTGIVYQNDYFDQSHYIREFKEFTGMNPKQFIHQTNEKVENFPEWKI
ncbi:MULTISPECIES: helix-turn-helix transcriptional regulator [Bacteroidota]|uniref:AraC family transcriptional regulator n=2 Tax=Bacteroidota TaxID=976 RepID=A0A101CH42_9FLAO|nr:MULTISPECIES: helix-turn-helix transcriptional regulator [Bacteroidota]KUJ56138.1 AraC family transcriptional regulator [Chryseobacterium aquaticum subsp. greenlandense]MBE8722493.1 AraC family transcriptional regulator [Sphingobacterium pedocola]